MKNTIKVESSEVTMDILLKNDITRNEKLPNKNFLLEQNHQLVCTICNDRVGMNIICCSECNCKIIICACFYNHISYITFIKRKRKYTCANGTPADVSDITPEIVDIEINELKDNLNEIESIITLLREENQKTQGRKYNNLELK